MEEIGLPFPDAWGIAIVGIMVVLVVGYFAFLF